MGRSAVTKRLLRRALTVTAVVVCALLNVSVAANAQKVFLTVTENPTFILQCPVAGCNNGYSYPEDLIVDYCTTDGQTVQGLTRWDLVQNLTDPDSRVVGYVPEAYLENPPPYDLNRDCRLHQLHTSVRANPTWILQCPTSNCNHGSAYPGDDLAVICQITDGQLVSGDSRWDLVIRGADQVAGWVPLVYLSTPPLVPPC